MRGYFCAICPTSEPCKCFTSTHDTAASARAAPHRLGLLHSSGLQHRAQGTANIPTQNLTTYCHQAAIFLLSFIKLSLQLQTEFWKQNPYYVIFVRFALHRTKLQHQGGSDPQSWDQRKHQEKEWPTRALWPSHLTLGPVLQPSWAPICSPTAQPHAPPGPTSSESHPNQHTPSFFFLLSCHYNCTAVCFLPAARSKAQLATGGEQPGKSQQWENTGPQRQSTSWSTEKPFFPHSSVSSKIEGGC